MRFKGKVAFVTGSSRGLGKATALAFAREGASVVVAARSEETGRLPGTILQTAEEIRSLGGQAFPVKCDVGEEESVNAAVAKAIDHFGRIDILVNNAGIAYPFPFWQIPLKRWELVFKVNTTGTFLCSKAVVASMMERKSGSIVNISSMAADIGKGPRAVTTGLAYGVAKAGVERLTWGMAVELQPYNIAVNAVKPTKVIDTEGMSFNAENVDKSGWTTPETMVKCILFLASQNASGVTGQIFTDRELVDKYSLA